MMDQQAGRRPARLEMEAARLHGRRVEPGDWVFVSTRTGWRSFVRVRQVSADQDGGGFAIVAGPGGCRALHVDATELLPLPQVPPIRYAGWRFTADA